MRFVLLWFLFSTAQGLTLPIANDYGAFTVNPDRITVAEVYFSRCFFCYENSENINYLSQEFENDRVDVVDIGRDCRESDYSFWVIETNPNHLVLNDCAGLVTGLVDVFPTMIIYHQNSEVYRHQGVLSDNEIELITLKIKHLLAID